MIIDTNFKYFNFTKNKIKFQNYVIGLFNVWIRKNNVLSLRINNIKFNLLNINRRKMSRYLLDDQ